MLFTTPVDVDVLVDTLLAKAAALADRDWVVDAKGVGIVVVDEQRIVQALLNLAGNAVRHTQPGDEIGIGVMVDDAAVLRCWVRDTGTGIDPEGVCIGALNEPVIGCWAKFPVGAGCATNKPD